MTTTTTTNTFAAFATRNAELSAAVQRFNSAAEADYRRARGNATKRRAVEAGYTAKEKIRAAGLHAADAFALAQGEVAAFYGSAAEAVTSHPALVRLMGYAFDFLGEVEAELRRFPKRWKAAR